MFGRIVVGVDRRQGGRDALALATLLQGVCGGELVALYVYPYDRTVSLDEAGAVEAVLHADLLAELDEELALAGVSARAFVVADSFPARAVQAVAERHGADLIVVGAPHRSGAEREPALTTVGVGFDDSPESSAALRLATRVSGAAGAALHVVSVATGTVAEHEAAAIAAGATYEAVGGTPAAELARRSCDLDLLAVGSRGHGPVRRLLLGSTSTRLVREARCPVLIVPRPSASAAGDEAGRSSAAA